MIQSVASDTMRPDEESLRGVLNFNQLSFSLFVALCNESLIVYECYSLSGCEKIFENGNGVFQNSL